MALFYLAHFLQYPTVTVWRIYRLYTQINWRHFDPNKKIYVSLHKCIRYMVTWRIRWSSFSRAKPTSSGSVVGGACFAQANTILDSSRHMWWWPQSHISPSWPPGKDFVSSTLDFFLLHVQGARGIVARFLKCPPASAVSPIMTKFSQYNPHSTCYLVLVSICRQD